MHAALVASGVGKGSRVGLLMENGPEWVAFALGATSIGALLAPISTFVHGDDLEYHLRHADIEHLFMSRQFLGRDYLELLTKTVPGLAQAGAGPLYLRRPAGAAQRHRPRRGRPACVVHAVGAVARRR